jgi:hypothetical protein
MYNDKRTAEEARYAIENNIVDNCRYRAPRIPALTVGVDAMIRRIVNDGGTVCEGDTKRDIVARYVRDMDNKAQGR